MKKLGILAVLALLITSVFAVSLHASTDNMNSDEIRDAIRDQISLNVDKVEVNGDPVELTETCLADGTCNILSDEITADIERGDTVDVEVKFNASEDVKDIRLTAEIVGWDHGDVRESTETFDIDEGRTKRKTLTLTVPEDIDEGAYTLRLSIREKLNRDLEINIPLDIESPRHSIKLHDVNFYPGLTVTAGDVVTTDVRVENFGEKDEDDIRVTVAAEELGLKDAQFIEEVNKNKKKSAPQMYIQPPVCTPAGDYQLTVTADYNDRRETVQNVYTLTVLESDRCNAGGDATTLYVGPETQNVVAGGSEVVYPILLTNAGKASKTYTLELVTGDWGEGRLSNNVVVVNAGETKSAHGYVKANSDAQTGEKLVTLKVTSGDETKEVSLKANVVNRSAAGWDSVKKGLEIGLVVLVVLLIILGLIVGFSRLKGDSDEEDDDDKTYY